MRAPPSTPSAAVRASKKVVSISVRSITWWASQVKSSASVPPSTPLKKPSMRNGARTKASVAPTRRMIEISRLRASTAMRIVDPMMMIDTAAKARPSTSPAAAATSRTR